MSEPIYQQPGTQDPSGQQYPPAAAYQPQPTPSTPGYYYSGPGQYPGQTPSILSELSGGMKAAWFFIGLLLGVPGILLAYVTTRDKVPKVKSDSVKFSVIGCIVCAVLVIAYMIIMFLFIGVFIANMRNMVPNYYWNY